MTNSKCGYPDTIRDGLKPVQYFCLAKVFLSDFQLEKAKECVEKIKAAKPASSENAKFVQILQECYFPKNPVPKEALLLLDKYFALSGNLEHQYEQQKIRDQLISKFPNFEWPYLLRVTEIPGHESKPDLEKVLAINPKNIETVSRLKDLRYGRDFKKEYEIAKKVLELDPGYQGLNIDSLKHSVEREELKRSQTPQAATREEVERKQVEIKARKQETKWVPKAYKFINKTGANVFYVGPNVKTEDQMSDGLLLAEVNAVPQNGAAMVSSNTIQYWKNDGDVAFSMDSRKAKQSSEGLCAVEIDQNSGGPRWGFFDHQGKQVIAPKFADVTPFQEGMAGVTIYVSRPFNMRSKSGFVDRSGAFKCEPIYDHCLPFSDGLAAVALNGKVGFIDKNGILSIPAKYDYVRSFSEGLAMTVRYDPVKRIMHESYIDITGKAAFEASRTLTAQEKISDIIATYSLLYSEQYTFHLDKIMDYRQDDFRDNRLAHWRYSDKLKLWKMGFIDKKGYPAFFEVYDKAEAFSNGMSRVMVGTKYGFINTQGKLVVPAIYSKSKSFSEGLAAVSTNGETWGYIDKAGKTVIEEKYLEANDFSNGVAKVGVAR